MVAVKDGRKSPGLNAVPQEDERDFQTGVSTLFDASIPRVVSKERGRDRLVETATDSGLRSDVDDREGLSRAALWRLQNAGAISDYNRMIETIGVPLAEFRKF